MKTVLGILLGISLCLNAYLLVIINQHVGTLKLSEQARPDTEAQTEQNDASVTSTATNKTSSELSNKTTSDNTNRQASAGDSVIIDTDLPPEALTLAYLKELNATGQYEALRFHIRRYLRLNPQDVDALLLEAEAYYYTEPLNTALINYYGLRDALISEQQLEDINQIIDVNTTRIIQQFSGDGSWDLLASFLEPLIQVDPLNRRYLLALAKAYGMQEQKVLMENVLAALPLNDPRAQRLRDSIYNTDDQAPDPIASQQSDDDVFSRTSRSRKEVRLIERQGQYYTNVELGKIDAQLLVDTGASITAVSDYIFAQIDNRNTSYLGNFTVQTAGGRVSSQMYKVSELTLGNTTVNNVSVMVLPSENMSNFDGLLGMNVIRLFNVSYDQAIGKMRMYRKE